MPDIALTTILENVFSKVILSGEIGCAGLQKEASVIERYFEALYIFTQLTLIDITIIDITNSELF